MPEIVKFWKVSVPELPIVAVLIVIVLLPEAIKLPVTERALAMVKLAVVVTPEPEIVKLPYDCALLRAATAVVVPAYSTVEGVAEASIL